MNYFPQPFESGSYSAWDEDVHQCLSNSSGRRRPNLSDMRLVALTLPLSLRQRRPSLEFHLLPRLALQSISSRCNKYIHILFLVRKRIEKNNL